MSWLSDYRVDVRRYQVIEGTSAFRALLLQQGLWALFQYRVAAAVARSSLPAPMRRMGLACCIVWRKVIEILTGIHLPYSATIGPGLHIGHFGNVIVNARARIGAFCNLAQGVTIGVSGTGPRRGVPVIGDHVHVGPNAVVAGKIFVGDHAIISANSLVLRSVPPHGLARGVPAEIFPDDTAGQRAAQHLAHAP